MSEFKREERYIVVKLKHLAGLQVAPLRNFLRENRVPTLDCVVVEKDWPEYEKVWRSIERRMTGQPAEDFDRVTAERDAALGREAALREEREITNRHIDRMIEHDDEQQQRLTESHKREDALQQRLTAADERADVLDGLAADVVECLWGLELPGAGNARLRKLRAALKPAEGGCDEAVNEG